MTTATIKLYLPQGDPTRLRTAEISNWTGMAIAAPRTDLEELLKRPEISRSGVYFLHGRDPNSDKPMAYIGEAEDIGKRLKQHVGKDFWVQVVVFVSKDEALTRAHIQYLEGRLIGEAQQIGRAKLDNAQSSGAKLPESDQADMEVFLSRMRQLLPVLGLDLLTPISQKALVPAQPADQPEPVLYHTIKGLNASGMRTPNGFVVLAGGQAVLKERSSAHVSHQFILDLRKQLREEGSLVVEGDHLRLTKDVEFSSPSTAAGVLQGGGANGRTSWHDASGKTLKQIEAAETE